ncbi:MAG: hypothetical protein ACEY3A_02525 [Wolbachia sp.]
MTAGLKFESAAGAQTTELDKVKIIILEDKTGNKYTLGLEGTGANIELKLKYTPKTGDEIEHTVDGLVKALGGLFNVKNGTKTVLAEEVAKKPVAEAILGVTKSTSAGPKSISV